MPTEKGSSSGVHHVEVEVRDVPLIAIRNPTLPATGPQVLGMKSQLKSKS